VNIPDDIIERARKYRAQANGDWGGWCDGSQTNEGHFQGIDVQSILADDVEVKLCKDCRQSICADLTYDEAKKIVSAVITENLADLTYDEAKKIVDVDLVKIKKLITEKEAVLKLLKFYFDALAYNSRTSGRCLKADE
jgi:hypothetical protein